MATKTAKSAARKVAADKAYVETAAFKAAEKVEEMAQSSVENFRLISEDLSATLGDVRESANKHLVAMGEAALDLAQANFNDGFEAARAALGAKDLREAFDIQSNYMRTVWERTSSESRKMAELVGAAARDTTQPLNGMASKFRAQFAEFKL